MQNLGRQTVCIMGNGNDLLYCFLFVLWLSPPQEFVTSSLPDRLKISLTPAVRKKTTAKYMGCSQLTAFKFWGRLLGQCQNCGLKESLFRKQQYLNIGSLKPRWRRQQDRQDEHLTTLNTWNTPFSTFFHVDCATYNVKLPFMLWKCYEGRKFSFPCLILDTDLGPVG